MATAALLVVLTSLVTAFLGTTLLRSYLLSRVDDQLQDFSKVASRIVTWQQLLPSDSTRPQTLPAQFLVEVVATDGQVSMAGGPLGATDGPRLSAAQLSDVGTPFTAPAAGTSGDSWRVLVQQLSGGGHLVIAYGLGDLDSTVTRLELLPRHGAVRDRREVLKLGVRPGKQVAAHQRGTENRGHQRGQHDQQRGDRHHPGPQRRAPHGRPPPPRLHRLVFTGAGSAARSRNRGRCG